MKPNQTSNSRLSLNKKSIVKLNDVQKERIAGGALAQVIGVSGCVCTSGASCGIACVPTQLAGA